MSLGIGTRLGRYEVIAAIGEGGMGQVYRARDTELGREVALKVLSDSFVHDPERLARFEREARTLASLNHAHIAVIHGVERSGGQTALVMELVEGEDLSRIVARGPMPLAETIPVARQIAEALDAAHERGIVHRDLKPANVKVRPDGTVKVLDFGLAKATDPPGTGVNVENSPTLTAQATRMGVILGTAAYMSPEQARGKPVDKRTDIWAFGVVLFEMIAGRRPFDGEDVTELMAAVVKSDPDWTRLPGAVPPHLARLIRRCLEKDRRKRVRDIGDVLIELDEQPPATSGASSLPPARTTARERLAWLAALVLISAVASIAAWRMKPATARSAATVTRFPLILPNDQQLGGPPTTLAIRRVGVSPDGAVIVYTANGQLYRRSLDDPKPVAISGADGTPYAPTFSPNGRSIAYLARDLREAAWVVKKVPAEGGPVITLAKLSSDHIHPNLSPTELDLSWGGSQIFLGGKNGVFAVPESGGTPQLIVPADPAKEVVSSPQLIAGGRQILFTVRRLDATGPQANSIVVQTLGTNTRQALVVGGAHGVLLPTGRMLYISGSNLMGVAFDAARAAVTGEPAVLTSDVTQRFEVSDAGTLVYEPTAGAAGPPTIVWVDRSGREEPVVTSSLPAIGNMRLSPDRTRIALTAAGDIWIWTFARHTMTRLSLTPTTVEYNPAWMPDGRRIVFDSGPQGAAADRQILLRQADGGGSARVISAAPGGWPDAIAPDGKYLMFHTLGALPSLMLQSIDPAGQPTLIAKSVALNADFSPDGRWIAYQSTESGRFEIYVQPFPAIETGRWQVSTEGGRYPLWSATGKELFFLSDANMLMATPIDPRSGFTYGTPVSLFPVGQYGQGSGSVIRNFDVSADGKKFLFVKQTVTTPPIAVVTNWFQEVERKLHSR
jgi:serine/threonine protein kinase/Tol biopolymer transport system component